MSIEQMDLKNRCVAVKARIDIACENAGRLSKSVRLLAVSKGQSADLIRQLYQLGQRDFGENYVDELMRKKEQLARECPLIRWHFIGQIQTNKAAKIAQSYLVHSVSTEKQARFLAKHRTPEDPLLALLQVNLGQELHRGGVSPANLTNLFVTAQALPGIRVLGLMAILPLGSEQTADSYFKQLRDVRDSLAEKLDVALPELSMGMSNDFEEAIAQGATWVRVGSLLFGPRQKV